MGRTRARKQRQTQLAFTPLPTSSPVRSSQPEAVRDRAAFIRIDDSPSPSKKRRVHANDANILLTPRPSMETKSTGTIATSPLSKSSRKPFMSSVNTSPHAGTNTSSRPRRAKRPTLIESDSDETPSATTPLTSRKVPVNVVDSESDDPIAPRSARVQKDGIITFNDSESDAPVMNSSPARKARPRRAKKPPIELSEDDSQQTVNRPRRGEESDDSLPQKPRRLHRKPRKGSEIEVDQDSSESDADAEQEEQPLTRSNRARHPSQPAAEPRSEQDQADLDSDLEFMGEADVESPRGLRHGSGQARKQGRQNLLEALKKKRQKQQRQRDGTSSQGDSRGIVEVDQSSSNVEEDDKNSEDDADSSDWADPVAEHEDDDFIVEEDEADGDHVALPFEFSQYATMKPIELFKFIVEWMVQKKINPAFAITDEVYEMAFRRLDDYVHGMGSSKFQSSAWTARFSRSLRNRPKLDSIRIAASPLHDRCDACNRSGHPATYEVRFTGSTYSHQTLEEDSEDESEDEHSVPRAGTSYFIGKHCHGNAQQAHAFLHWKFHLNEWVVDYLKEQGELSAAKIVERDGWSTKRRRRDAERIVDTMESNGEIKSLRKDFKSEIETAQMKNNDANARTASP